VGRAGVMLVELLPEHLRECLGLANEQGLSIYDASYLWLARLHDVQLLTHDARLAEAAGRVGVSVITAEQLT
jgi:predicted nucleic acid-binding protein